MPTPNSSPIQQALALAKKWGTLTRQNVQLSPQVAALMRTGGEVLAGDAVEAMANLLTFASAQFNVGKNLSDVQVALLAPELLRIYWYWRFDEFAYVLREAVAGRYGTTYDRIDAPTVHEWCLKYEAERGLIQANACEQQTREFKKAEQQPSASPLTTHPEFGGDYAGARAQLEALSDGNLQATERHYRQQTGADNQFIADVAQEVISERNVALFARQLRERLATQTTRRPSLREQMHEAREKTRERINAKLLGENSPVWGIAQHWLDVLDVEAEPVDPPAPVMEAQHTATPPPESATTLYESKLAIAS